MPLTPADVHSVVFNKSPIGKRGYHEDEVDAFLDLVEAELARLVAENEQLRSRLEQLDHHQEAALVDTESAGGPPEPSCPVVTALAPTVGQAVVEGDPNAHAARVLGLAQQMADRLTSQAQVEADAVLDQARIQAEQLLGDAKAKVDGLLQEVRTRAEAVLTDARATAEAVERRSQEQIALREREAARQHSETITVLNHEKHTLENKIDRLRALERDYRTHLKNYFTAQLYKLDPDETVPPPAPLPNVQSLSTLASNAQVEAGSCYRNKGPSTLPAAQLANYPASTTRVSRWPAHHQVGRILDPVSLHWLRLRARRNPQLGQPVELLSACTATGDTAG